MTARKPPPLLGYNTNVRHGGVLFHIQTEDSGVDHPHIITHLFVEGTILATKKCSYADKLTEAHWDEIVRHMMKDQHRLMFIELRDGVHDAIAEKIFGPMKGAGEDAEAAAEADDIAEAVVLEVDENGDVVNEQVTSPSEPPGGVRVIRPAEMGKKSSKPAEAARAATAFRGRSIFDAPTDNGEFGENLITDKSLDEVILSYLTDELEE